VRTLVWWGRILLWGADEVGEIEPREDGSCIGIVRVITPSIPAMREPWPTRVEARRWVETQAKTLLVLEGHDVDGAQA
jgi:hypothetical protein